MFDFLVDFASPFRTPPPHIEDCVDEAVGHTLFTLWHATLLIHHHEKVDFMSFVDNNSEGDFLGVNDSLSAFPTLSLDEWPVSDDSSTLFSRGYSAMHRARSTAARYSTYNLPSREQRHAFIWDPRRKEMFVDAPDDASILPAEPSTFHPMADLALPSVHVDTAALQVEECLTQIIYEAQSQSDQTIEIPCAVDRLGLQLLDSCIVSEQAEGDDGDEDVVDYATQNTGLTIKIPGLVDRLALLLPGSCNVNEQTEERGDVDGLSLDGSITSESSCSSGDDDHTSPFYTSSPVLMAAGPDRTSRRKHRRIAAPYHRTEGMPKRKELWVDTYIMAGSNVPAC